MDHPLAKVLTAQQADERTRGSFQPERDLNHRHA
jgi:hypothetical protein